MFVKDVPVVYVKDTLPTELTQDRVEHLSHSWQPYRHPNEETGWMAGRWDSLTDDDGTGNMCLLHKLMS